MPLYYKKFKFVFVLVLFIAITSQIFGALTFQSVDIVSIIADPMEDCIANISTPFFSETEELESVDVDEVVDELLAS